MSQTYNLGCKFCKESIWIAQGSYTNLNKGHIYSNPEASQILYQFFIKHKGHELVFDTSENIESEGMREIDVSSK